MSISTRNIKALAALVFTGACLTLIGMEYQTRISGSSAISGSSEMSPPQSGGAGSVGPAGAIQAADGASGFQDTGCVNYSGVFVCGLTYNTTRTITDGTRTCPLMPDTYYWNVDVHTYPRDTASPTYISYLTNPAKDFTGASWSGGTATITVADTTGISNAAYGIYGAVSGNCPSGLDCGFNSNSTTVGEKFTVTVTDGTHFTYPLASNPGSWSSGGKIVLLQKYRISPIPGMALNYATNSTATLDHTNSLWDSGAIVSDNGPYPWMSNFFLEGYNNTISGGYIPTLVTTSQPGEDNHVLSVNMNTCTLYESFFLTTQAPPWHNGNGAIWDLRSPGLRTLYKPIPSAAFDSSGMTSADVAGFPIWPMVLTYDELYSGSPIKHAIRLTLPTNAGIYDGYQWPATHSNCCTANYPTTGSRWLLSPTFDTTTCHFAGCSGQAWPDYMKRLFTALQTYGVLFADGGNTGISLDADSRWGAVDGPPSAIWDFAGFMHGVQMQDGYFIDSTTHQVNAVLGLLK